MDWTGNVTIECCGHSVDVLHPILSSASRLYATALELGGSNKTFILQLDYCSQNALNGVKEIIELLDTPAANDNVSSWCKSNDGSLSTTDRITLIRVLEYLDLRDWRTGIIKVVVDSLNELCVNVNITEGANTKVNRTTLECFMNDVLSHLSSNGLVLNLYRVLPWSASTKKRPRVYDEVVIDTNQYKMLFNSILDFVITQIEHLIEYGACADARIKRACLFVAHHRNQLVPDESSFYRFWDLKLSDHHKRYVAMLFATNTGYNLRHMRPRLDSEAQTQAQLSINDIDDGLILNISIVKGTNTNNP